MRERLDDPLAYTTVLTVLQTLEAKGHVRHEEEGRAYRYHPTVAAEEAGASGTATAWVLAGRDGQVRRARIQDSSGDQALDRAALEGARAMEFEPARS